MAIAEQAILRNIAIVHRVIPMGDAIIAEAPPAAQGEAAIAVFEDPPPSPDFLSHTLAQDIYAYQEGVLLHTQLPPPTRVPCDDGVVDASRLINI